MSAAQHGIGHYKSVREGKQSRTAGNRITIKIDSAIIKRWLFANDALGERRRIVIISKISVRASGIFNRE